MGEHPKTIIEWEDIEGVRKLKFNSESLASIVSQVGDRKLAIVSIIGPFRTGKSFLLSLMVRYLKYLENEEEGKDWLHNDDPLVGFPFEGTMDLVTTGIQIWSRPFFVAPDTAVLLMDTPGIYEPSTSLREWAGIAGTTLLLSSCTIFNISHNLQEDSLTTLESFLEYGKLIAESKTDDDNNSSSSSEANDHKHFQRILFLIRDWSNPSEFGYGPGAPFLKRKLESAEGMSDDAKALREAIQSSVQELACYLLPNPGDSEFEYGQPIEEFDPSFESYLRHFITEFLKADRIKPKCSSQGNFETADSFLRSVENYVRAFNTSFSADIGIQASVQIRLERLIQECLQYYHECCSNLLQNKQKKKPVLQLSDLNKHSKTKDTILQVFREKSKCDPKILPEFLKRLDAQIEAAYSHFQTYILDHQKSIMVQAEKTALEDVNSQLEKLSLNERASPSAFKNAWDGVRAAAAAQFQKQVQNLESPLQQDFGRKIEQAFLQLHEDAKARNAARVQALVQENEPTINLAIEIYTDKVDLVLGEREFINPGQLQAAHDSGLKAAQTIFSKKTTVSNVPAVQNLLLQKLGDRIQEQYQNLVAKNEACIQSKRAAFAQYGEKLLSGLRQESVAATECPNPSEALQQLKYFYKGILSNIEDEFNGYLLEEKTILEGVHSELLIKLQQIYTDAEQKLGIKKESQRQHEDHIVQQSLQAFNSVVDSILKDNPNDPEDLQLLLKTEKETVIATAKSALESIQSSQIQNLVGILSHELDTETERTLEIISERLFSLREQLQIEVSDRAHDFQTNISTLEALRLTRDDLANLLNETQIATQQQFLLNSSNFKFPSNILGECQRELEQQIQGVIENTLRAYDTELEKTIENVIKGCKNELSIAAAQKTQELEDQNDILDEDKFRREFSTFREQFLRDMKKDLVSKFIIPESSLERVVQSLSEALSLTESKSWSHFLKRNRECEDKIRGGFSPVKKIYFQEALAQMDDSPQISMRIMKQFFSDYKISSPELQKTLKDELNREFRAIDVQIEADDAKALEVEQSKQQLKDEFLQELEDCDEVEEADSLITQCISKLEELTRDGNVLRSFKEELERSKETRIRNQQIAHAERLVDLIGKKFGALLRKGGSSQEQQLKQTALAEWTKGTAILTIDLQEYRTRLDDFMKTVLDEYEEELKSHMSEERVQEILTQVLRSYREEMSKHFTTNKFYTLQRLTELHTEAYRVAITNTPDARSEDGDISTKARDAVNEALKEFDSKNSMNAPNSFAIGIDLGTTYTCVGVYMNGRVEIIPNDIGLRTTPSYVYYGEDEVIVGETAKSQSHSYPERTIYEVKRLIGRSLEDPAIQGDINRWPFKVVNERGMAKVQVGDKTYHPEEVSAEILKKIKATAEAYLSREVTAAVITVPAYFTDGQKAATKLAGDEAGLNVLRIISEPTAAAIAYNLNWTEGQSSVRGLVYDLGGGTFDVALFTATRGDIRIVNVGGDTHLGGVDFDNELVNFCAREFERQTGVDLLKDQESKDWKKRTALNRVLMRLKRECEKSKMALSVAESRLVAMDTIHNGQDLRVNVTREQLETMIDPYIDNSLVCVQKVLAEAQLGKDDIDEIVLIGGSTRIPRVRDRLVEFFGKGLNSRIDPDQAVAFGAAYEAAVLNGRRIASSGGAFQAEFAPQGVSTQDITPMAYGIEIEGGEMCILIPRQSPVPTEASQTFVTSYHHQTSVQIVIYEGESPQVAQNTLVGEFYLNGIPPGLAGQHNVRVTMKVDPDGMITVSATCVENGVAKDLTVRSNTRRMTRA